MRIIYGEQKSAGTLGYVVPPLIRLVLYVLLVLFCTLCMLGREGETALQLFVHLICLHEQHTMNTFNIL